MNMLLLTGVVGALALGYAAVASGKIGAFKVDHARVNELSGIIQGGAMAFLYREYKALVPFVIVVGALLAWSRMEDKPAERRLLRLRSRMQRPHRLRRNESRNQIQR